MVTTKSAKAAPKTAKVSLKAQMNGKATKKPIQPKEGQPCLCGCDGTTAGGKFLPGHDAKLKGIFQQSHRNGGLDAGQQKLVGELGWERFLEPGVTVSKAQIELGLSTPQVHILKALVKAPNGLTRQQIKEKANVSLSMTSQLGPVHSEDVATDKNKGSLLARKFALCKVEDVEGKDVALYTISASGKKALEKLK